MLVLEQESSVINKKDDKKIIGNNRLISLLNLHRKIYTTIFKNRMQKNLGAITG